MSKTKIFVLTISFLFLALLFPLHANGQEISLSISPPIIEVTIHPGKTVTQLYEISNDSSSELYLTTKIVEFEPADLEGNIRLDKSETKKPFFSLDSDRLALGETFKLSPGTKKQLKLKIAIPEDEPENDYYFTFLIEQSDIGEFVSQPNSNLIKLGSNILLTISNTDNPKKEGKVIKFSPLPKIADIFNKVNFKIIAENSGKSFFKSEGKIEIINLANRKTVKTLNLRPDNILAGYSRNLVCFNEDKTEPCRFSSFMPGVFRATISFLPDGIGEKQSISSTFVILPIKIVVFILASIILWQVVKKTSANSKNRQEITT